MNVLFLDIDGVVNTPSWRKSETGYKCGYSFPDDGKVNDEQAIQWLSEFCLLYKYDLVFSSTWRHDGVEKCFEYLRNAGLRDGIKAIGKTPYLGFDAQRGDEIGAWLKQHPEVDNYLILDDDADMTEHMDKLIRCNPFNGFRLGEFQRAVNLHLQMDFCKVEDEPKNQVLKDKGMIVVGGTYEHYKGNKYRVLAVGKNSETLEDMVTYQALYGDNEIWIRPLKMWFDIIDEKVTRFTLVD